VTLNPFKWIAALFPCAHESTYRERQDLSDDLRGVYHFVCEDCGQSWPVVSRTPEQHREIQQAGRAIASRVWKVGQ
jgi:hypothetical protein